MFGHKIQAPNQQLTCEANLSSAFTTFTTKYHWEINEHAPCDDMYQQEFQSTTFPLDGSSDMTCKMFFSSQEDTSPLTFTFFHTENVIAIHLAVYRSFGKSLKYDKNHECWFVRPFPVVYTADEIVLHAKRRPLTFAAVVQFTIVRCGWHGDDIFKSLDEIAYRTPRANFLENFKVMFDNKTLCDVTFVLGDEEISAHKSMLAAWSKVFEAMFLSEMIEKEKSKVVIVDTEIKIFERFLNYFYTGDVSDLAEVVEEVTMLADKYQVDDLKTLCENHMVKNLSIANVVRNLFIADKFSCPKLKQKSIEFLQNSSPKTLTEETLNMLKNLGEILSNNSALN